jgi:hypothetical protein
MEKRIIGKVEKRPCASFLSPLPPYPILAYLK